MSSRKFIEFPLNQVILLDNITCPYCGTELNKNNNTKEHVIGRKFIPKGLLDGQWNLILRACGRCNSLKSDLENDISAITLAGGMWFGPDGSIDDSIVKEAQRKAKNSFSKKTKKPVIHSQEEFKIETSFVPGATLKFNLISPPQIDDTRLFELARMQLMAFFYFITFDKLTKKGGFWLKGFHPVLAVHSGDWGNAPLSAFMTKVATWEPRWVGITADGFFKSIIRRHPSEECWSWALEWNKNYRLVGFFGERKPAQEIVNKFPPMKMADIQTVDETSYRYRVEAKLPEEDDLLFYWEKESA